MPYVPDYYTGAPSVHKNNEEICDPEDERELLAAEYEKFVTGEEWEPTEEEQKRCLFLEERLQEIEREISYLTEE